MTGRARARRRRGPVPACGTRPRSNSMDDDRRGQKREQHRQRRAVGGGREGNQDDERGALPARKRLGAQHHEIEREHAEPGENVGEQDARDPRQRGRDRQHGDRAQQHERTPAQPVRAQHERDDPDRQRRLHHDRGPEIRPCERDQEEAVDGRAAHLQRALEPAREIAAGVVFQEREAVPQRRREQQQRCRAMPPRASIGKLVSCSAFTSSGLPRPGDVAPALAFAGDVAGEFLRPPLSGSMPCGRQAATTSFDLSTASRTARASLSMTSARRAGRRHQPEPDRGVEIRHAGLRHGRHVRQDARPLRRPPRPAP